MKDLVCVECQKEIDPSGNYMMLAIEVPYYNVFFHKDCYEEVLKECGGWDGLRLYLARSSETWYNRESRVGKRE